MHVFPILRASSCESCPILFQDDLPSSVMRWQGPFSAHFSLLHFVMLPSGLLWAASESVLVHRGGHAGETGNCSSDKDRFAEQNVHVKMQTGKKLDFAGFEPTLIWRGLSGHLFHASYWYRHFYRRNWVWTRYVFFQLTLGHRLCAPILEKNAYWIKLYPYIYGHIICVCIYIYIIIIFFNPGVSAGCPPSSGLLISWLSTCWSAGCPHTGSHCKNRFLFSCSIFAWPVEMWFWWKYWLWCCRFACILGVDQLWGRKK